MPQDEHGPSALDLCRQAEQTLLAARVPSARMDAESLLRHVLAWDRARLLASPDHVPDPAERRSFLSLVAERANRRPLQHLTGVQEFWRRPFGVNRSVLIPRPETELVVEAALALLRDRPNPKIADIGTGSGCIAISLALDLPGSEVHATDLSPDALAVARDNALRLGAGRSVSFHLGDLVTPLATRRGEFDLVASNPPYVSQDERARLEPEVRDHEPPMALFAPGDPSSMYRRLVPEARGLLRGGGWLVLEIGFGQADEVSRICTGAGFTALWVVADLQQIPRVIVACNSSAAQE